MDLAQRFDPAILIFDSRLLNYSDDGGNQRINACAVKRYQSQERGPIASDSPGPTFLLREAEDRVQPLGSIPVVN
jgi:hypothetical protein